MKKTKKLTEALEIAGIYYPPKSDLFLSIEKTKSNQEIYTLLNDYGFFEGPHGFNYYHRNLIEINQLNLDDSNPLSLNLKVVKHLKLFCNNHIGLLLPSPATYLRVFDHINAFCFLNFGFVLYYENKYGFAKFSNLDFFVNILDLLVNGHYDKIDYKQLEKELKYNLKLDSFKSFKADIERILDNYKLFEKA